MKTAPRRKRSSKRRRDILDASLHCFMQNGIHAATIEQIREASGASAGSIYHHFGSKQAIAVALYLEGMEELNVIYREAMNDHAELRDGIRALIHRYFQWVSEHRDWALYLLRVATADLSPEDAAKIDEINRNIREDLSQWLRPFAARGEMIQLPEELYSSLIFGASTHYARHWLLGRLSLDLTVAADRLAETTWIALTRDGELGRRGIGEKDKCIPPTRPVFLSASLPHSPPPQLPLSMPPLPLSSTNGQEHAK